MEDAMAGERLFEFDSDLCDYVLGNLRQYLLSAVERPGSTGELRLAEWELLDFPDWFARQLSGPFAALADRIWAGVFGDVRRTPLSESELSELAAVLDDLPDRLARTCVWESYPARHAQYVECVTEIRTGLTRQTAEEWAEASGNFATRLCVSPLSLAEGISLVHEWVGMARRLCRAMGAMPGPVDAGAGRGAKEAKRLSRTRRDERQREPHEPIEPVMLSPTAISEKYSVSRSTIYAACRLGMVPHYRVPSKRGASGKYLIRETDLLAWFASLKSSAGPMTPSASAPASSRSAPAAPFCELDASRLARAWQDQRSS
jgi:hypothetical protein